MSTAAFFRRPPMEPWRPDLPQKMPDPPQAPALPQALDMPQMPDFPQAPDQPQERGTPREVALPRSFLSGVAVQMRGFVQHYHCFRQSKWQMASSFGPAIRQRVEVYQGGNLLAAEDRAHSKVPDQSFPFHAQEQPMLNPCA